MVVAVFRLVELEMSGDPRLGRGALDGQTCFGGNSAGELNRRHAAH